MHSSFVKFPHHVLHLFILFFQLRYVISISNYSFYWLLKLVTCLHDGSLHCFCLLAESCETINQFSMTEATFTKWMCNWYSPTGCPS